MKTANGSQIPSRGMILMMRDYGYDIKGAVVSDDNPNGLTFNDVKALFAALVMGEAATVRRVRTFDGVEVPRDIPFDTFAGVKRIVKQGDGKVDQATVYAAASDAATASRNDTYDGTVVVGIDGRTVFGRYCKKNGLLTDDGDILISSGTFAERLAAATGMAEYLTDNGTDATVKVLFLTGSVAQTVPATEEAVAA